MAHHAASVILLLVFGRAPLILVFTLALALYLTVVELRELKPHWKWWAWWLLFVALTHFFGYLILRGYAFLRRRQRARA